MAGKPKKGMDPESEGALSFATAERDMERLKQGQQLEREQLIAQAHEVIGQIRAMKMVTSFGNVAGLMWLNQIRESKLYKDLPNIGTWEEFCNYIGLSRRKVEEDLQNLSIFGDEFLATVAGLKVGYRELRKLRQLTYDGTLVVNTDAIEIGGERIPLNADHKEDLQAALERVLDEKEKALEEANATIRTRDKEIESKRELIHRQEKVLSKFEKEANDNGLTIDEDAYLKRLEELKIGFTGYQLRIKNAVRDLELVPGERTSAALLAFLNQARMELNCHYNTAVDHYAPAGMVPEEEWSPGKGAETMKSLK